MRQVHLPVVDSGPSQLAAPLPQPNTKVDCVVIGYNDLDFHSFAVKQRPKAKISGSYFEAQSNAVRLNGKWLTYMDLLNEVLTRAQGVNPELSAFEVPNLGACHLANHLRKRGFTVEIINLFNQEKERLKQLLADAPNVVAITTTYYVEPSHIIDTVRFIRQHNQHVHIVVGGPYIFRLLDEGELLTQDYILQSIGADIYIADVQGMQSLAAVVAAHRERDQLKLEHIPNLVFTWDNKKFSRTRREVESYDINDNYIDWSLFKEEFFSLPMYMRTAMSCPFSCSFCNFPTMAGEHKLAEIDVIERECMQLKAANVKYMVFIDDTFNVPLPRFKRLLRMMIKNQFNFKWMSFFRCSNADDETFDLMRESGCMAVFLGIESGDERILSNMKKFARPDKYIEGIHKLTERGIASHAAIIVGFPGETQETVLNTIKFLEEAAPTFYNLQLYYHDVRTPIQAEVEKYNIQRSSYSWSHSTMNWQEAAKWLEYMYKNVKNSIPLAAYGFNIWSLPYLLSKGLTLQQFKDFAMIARELLVRSFEDRDIDFSEQLGRMSGLFKGMPMILPHRPRVPQSVFPLHLST